jgi:hypothetical protein
MTRADLDPDLARLGAALRTGAALDLARRESATPRRGGFRGGAAAAMVVLAVVAVGVFALTRPSSGESAFARQTLLRAAAVLTPQGSSHVILHIDATETLSPLARRGAGTTVSTLTEQAWIQQGSRGGERTILHVPGGPRLEQDSGSQIYNETDNLIYPAPQAPRGKPRYRLTATGQGGYRLRVKLPHGGFSTQHLTASTAQALHDGQESVQWIVSWNARTQTQRVQALVLPTLRQLQQTQVEQPDPASTGFAAQLHGLLHSGHARVTATTTSDGRPAIEISSVRPQSGPQTNYYVNPRTDAPIELDTFGFHNPRDITRLHISTYQTLPLAGHEHLLKVTIRANAREDHTPAAYWDALGLPRPF